jgi:hypothetical protein
MAESSEGVESKLYTARAQEMQKWFSSSPTLSQKNATRMGQPLQKYPVGIRCTGVEEFSGGESRVAHARRKGERDQSVEA